MCLHSLFFFFFFFNDTATTEIYTLSLHDALPIFGHANAIVDRLPLADRGEHLVMLDLIHVGVLPVVLPRSEEHTSELQSQSNLVCRLLLEKKKKHRNNTIDPRHLDNYTAPTANSS